MMRDISNIQAAFVADHIAALRREGDALRAERQRDHRLEHLGADDIDHRADLPSRRVRLGRWLVAVGEAVAGSRRTTAGTARLLTATASADDPCGDGRDRLMPAA